MKLVYLTLFFSLMHSGLTAQDTIQSRIVLIADGGELTNGHHPVVSAARKTITFDKKTTVLFIGDNLYKRGLPDESTPNFNKIKAALDSQAVIANGTDAKVYFMPGNHDWKDGGREGWDQIIRQQEYIDNVGNKNVEFFPKGGCPGPEEIEISPDVTLVIMDSQWWVHLYDKPGIESDCPYKTQDEVINELDNILTNNFKKLVIVAFHHTLKSVGVHGGYFALKQHLFPFTEINKNVYLPLPFIGSIYPITRGIFGTSEDLHHPLYQNMITKIEEVVKGHKNVIFVAGHEHSLQLIQDSSINYIVTGSGSKATRVYKNRKSLFASDKHGFATLEITNNKVVHNTFYTVEGEKITKVFQKDLLDFSKITLPKDDSTKRDHPYSFKDSVIISASDRYKNVSKIKKKFIGENYRKEWSTPIKLKVFNINKEHGGFEIKTIKLGRQTKSLRLVDKKGQEWLLRSVDKNPEKTLPENLRGTIANKIAQDLVSASYPFGAFIVPTLAKACGVLSANPQYYFVPDDYALGIFRPLFANTVCLLEEREPTFDYSDTKSTAKIINKLIDNNNNRIDQPAVLKARLLDMLIGDWDRHYGQWRWGSRDTSKGRIYYPIPRDRDQAFFYSDGLLLKRLANNQFKYLQGFKKNYPDIKWLNWEARDFDRFFLNGLNEQQWRDNVNAIQQSLTDEVIENAVKKLPPEIYEIDHDLFVEKLKSRRDLLMDQALKYYRFISKTVSIPGTNDKEYYHIKNDGKNNLEVIEYKRKKSSDTASIMYDRVFDSRVTKHIWLFGLNNTDKFLVDENAESKTALKIIGGKGNDTFDIRGKVKTNIYDLRSDQNVVLNKSHSKVYLSNDPAINEYKTSGFNYNSLQIPQMDFGYNVEDQFFMGVGFTSKTYGFRKEPYATYQRLKTLYAFSNNAYQVHYDGVFNQIIGRNDIVINAKVVHPALDNFFGSGNNTLKDNSKSLYYYRVRYNYISSDVILRKRMNDVVHFGIGPSYFHYNLSYGENKNWILGTPSIIGLDSTNVFARKDYLGGKIRMDITYINSDFFPTRGITWNTEFTDLYGLSKTSRQLSKITSDMTVYASLTEERRLMVVFRLGGGHIFSKNFDYFQSLNLGNNNFLRGYRKDRYSGSSTAYANAEVRIKLFDSKWYILPGDLGTLAFYDVGRVWLPGEHSKTWHQDFGGGFYFAPFNALIVSATLGISNEDQIFNFSIGKKFNLTF